MTDASGIACYSSCRSHCYVVEQASYFWKLRAKYQEKRPENYLKIRVAMEHLSEVRQELRSIRAETLLDLRLLEETDLMALASFFCSLFQKVEVPLRLLS